MKNKLYEINMCPVLSRKEIMQILYLSKQGPSLVNRVRLICNLYEISKSELYSIVKQYS